MIIESEYFIMIIVFLKTHIYDDKIKRCFLNMVIEFGNQTLMSFCLSDCDHSNMTTTSSNTSNNTPQSTPMSYKTCIRRATKGRKRESLLLGVFKKPEPATLALWRSPPTLVRLSRTNSSSLTIWKLYLGTHMSLSKQNKQQFLPSLLCHLILKFHQRRRHASIIPTRRRKSQFMTTWSKMIPLILFL